MVAALSSLLRRFGAAAWLVASLALAGLAAAQAQDLQAVPELSARVLDYTGALDAKTRQKLEARLAALEQAKGSQLVILMVPTTAPEDIASYANRVGNAWKIGRRGVGDGVLVVVAKNDRRVRIEVAKALEGAIPDLAAKQIIDEAITPRFRQGDFGGGLDAAVSQLTARIQGEALPTGTATGAGDQRGDLLENLGLLILMLFVGVPFLTPILRALLGRTRAAGAMGAITGALAWWLASGFFVIAIAAAIAGFYALLLDVRAGRPGSGGFDSGSSGSSSGGGFGSGGFSSGGGGDFGGGGASGDW